MIEKKCPYCEKVEFKNIGSFNLHKNQCELRALRADRDSRTDKGNKDPGNGRVHVHEYRLLEEDGSQETRAIAAGYDRVCIGCGDVKRKGK
jgi:hypothetical protein